jgi:Zn-dependent peptidase ImmA (M78 family)
MHRDVGLASPGDWLEWQANRFAGALLMPRMTVKRALVGTQMHLGIRRGIGTVWVDWRHKARGDLNRMSIELGTLYRVPKAVVIVRLRHLDLLRQENVPRTMIHLRDVMDEIAREFD